MSPNDGGYAKNTFCTEIENTFYIENPFSIENPSSVENTCHLVMGAGARGRDGGRKKEREV